MSVISRLSASEAYYQRPSGATLVRDAVHYRPLRLPPPGPSVADNVRRMFAEPFEPGSLAPGPIQKDKNNATREKDTKLIQNGPKSEPIPPLLFPPIEVIGEAEEVKPLQDKQDVGTFHPPQLDIAVPSPTLLLFPTGGEDPAFQLRQHPHFDPSLLLYPSPHSLSASRRDCTNTFDASPGAHERRRRRRLGRVLSADEVATVHQSISCVQPLRYAIRTPAYLIPRAPPAGLPKLG